MRIAVVGSGISGLTCAYLLSQKYDVQLFEKNDRLGGHTATKAIHYDGADYHIDTGFIVFNDWTYPNFIRLLERLGVSSQATEMGFSVSCEQSGLEYSGDSLNTLFAQRRRIVSPTYWRFVMDILKFNRSAKEDLAAEKIDANMTLGQYLKIGGYSKLFVDKYLVPMGSAIWSMSCEAMLDFPLQFFVRFFKNHGLLNVNDRPVWRTIQGGSHSYIEPLVESFKDRIQLNADVSAISRTEGDVTITVNGGAQTFDHVVLACHSDQALKLLQDPSREERDVLSAIAYENNEVVLHADTALLPDNPLTWSSWNYRIKQQKQTLPTLTYNMNILQKIQSEHTFCVTLNDTGSIKPEKIIGQYQYAHPQFTLAGEKSKARWSEISGHRATSYCGAYWHNGFHEDGVVSAIRVAKYLGVDF
jgi:predicted NAD/FAD-binding protein